MTQQQFGFYFERAGLAATQGAIAPAEQFFEGSGAEVSVVRETGQNSLDAVAGDGPVRMEFELADMSTDSIRGIGGLREHLVRVEQDTWSTQGHSRMSRALQLSSAQTVPVLRISDYGTAGLGGSESLADPKSPLAALTRGAGISADDGSRGGSFGIGSAVGPMASDLCTVFYTSLPLGETDVVFAGYSRLATHEDADGVLRVGDGFFTDLSVTNDFRYLRNPGQFGPFGPRTVPGTDIYIVGYRKAGDDPDLNHIRDAFVDNFMMAIHEGRLVVDGIGRSERWHLDAQTLEGHARRRPESKAFYRAICDPTPTITTSTRFGELRLYINVDAELKKKLHTITMRRPLMRIDEFRHTSIPANYAAVLVCADLKGNELLRKLEPPQHNKWDPGREIWGPAAVKELKEFVRKALRERVQETVGEIVEVKGLARFLPSDDLTVRRARPGLGEGAEQEISTVQGREGPARQARVQPPRKVSVRVQQPARSTEDGGEPGTKGKNAGGSGKRTGSGGDLPGNTQPGAGGSRISGGQVGFRSWSAPSPESGRATLQVALTAQENIEGDLELVALGAGGTPESYKLPILSAHMTVDGTRTPIDFKENVFKSVKLVEGQTTRLDIEIEAGHRYRLDVK